MEPLVNQSLMGAPIPKPEPIPEKRVMPSHHAGMGPLIGAALIVALLAFGALYFWGAHLNAIEKKQQLPLIPGDAPARQ